MVPSQSLDTAPPHYMQVKKSPAALKLAAGARLQGSRTPGNVSSQQALLQAVVAFNAVSCSPLSDAVSRATVVQMTSGTHVYFLFCYRVEFEATEVVTEVPSTAGTVVASALELEKVMAASALPDTEPAESPLPPSAFTGAVAEGSKVRRQQLSCNGHR